MSSKKDFKTHPALAHISEATAYNAHTDNAINTHTDNTHSTHTDNAHKKETKSKRLNLLLFPSVAEAIEKIATMRRTSPNNLINEILREYIGEHNSEIERYNSAFREVKKE